MHDHLGREVLGSAAEGFACLVFGKGFGQSVIDDLEVALIVDQDVFKFQISVHDALGMQITDGHADLSSVEAHHVFTEALL